MVVSRNAIEALARPHLLRSTSQSPPHIRWNAAFQMRRCNARVTSRGPAAVFILSGPPVDDHGDLGIAAPSATGNFEDAVISISTLPLDILACDLSRIQSLLCQPLADFAWNYLSTCLILILKWNAFASPSVLHLRHNYSIATWTVTKRRR
ncbi:hypothetical protein BDZ89DRAFT_577364 [Hymenopellis radicata]|nr:hypothetical protein BDZ89DRAFT_577364 [Hymenopellis radicata]